MTTTPFYYFNAIKNKVEMYYVGPAPESLLGGETFVLEHSLPVLVLPAAFGNSYMLDWYFEDYCTTIELPAHIKIDKNTTVKQAKELLDKTQ